MNIEQAKRIPLEEFLMRMGHRPSRSNGGQLWYLSPLRTEATASFKVNTSMNTWYDFGQGQGGDIIDLVKAMEKVSTVSESLARINAIMGDAPATRFVQPKRVELESEPTLELESIGPIQSKHLFAYLRERGIDPRLAQPKIQEARYRCGDNHFTALACENDSGGYELRNPTFKGTLGHKDVSTIVGGTTEMCVFEGFFDYLSAIMLHGPSFQDTSIILNSVAMRERSLKLILELEPQSLRVFRDNDPAGEALLAFYVESLPSVTVIDEAQTYAGHNDLNEWLVSQKRLNSHKRA
jgi:hypothetical protein